MKKNDIIITTGSIDELAKDFIEAWHQAEDGKKIKMPVEKIYFEDEQSLFKTLTPARCDMLKVIHGLGKTSIRALAKELNRDYKNVHRDVKALADVGLILKDEDDGQYFVPWRSVITEIPLSDEPVQSFNPNMMTHVHTVPRRSQGFLGL